MELADQGAFGPYGPLLLAFALLAAWLGTDLLIPWVTRFAYRFGHLDHSDLRKVHKAPIPRLGGIAIFFGFALAMVLAEVLTPGRFFPLDGPLRGIVVGGVMMFGLGVADDIWQLSAQVKLFGQVSAAAIAFLLGVRIEFLSQPGGGMWVLPLVYGLPLVSGAISLFWIVGITNTINLIDGLDGLAAGVSLIAALTLAMIAMETNQPLSAIMAVAMVGSLCGFLRYNFNPAKIFMGDGGSLFLGFVLATISVIGVLKLVAAVTILLPLLILGLPIADTTFAIVRRIWNRRPIFSPDRGHFHHRLLSAGLSHRNAVIMLYGFSGALAGLSLVFLHIQGSIPMLFAATAFLAWGCWNLWGKSQTPMGSGVRQLPAEIEPPLACQMNDASDSEDSP